VRHKKKDRKGQGDRKVFHRVRKEREIYKKIKTEKNSLKKGTS